MLIEQPEWASKRNAKVQTGIFKETGPHVPSWTWSRFLIWAKSLPSPSCTQSGPCQSGSAPILINLACGYYIGPSSASLLSGGDLTTIQKLIPCTFRASKPHHSLYLQYFHHHIASCKPAGHQPTSLGARIGAVNLNQSMRQACSSPLLQPDEEHVVSIPHESQEILYNRPPEPCLGIASVELHRRQSADELEGFKANADEMRALSFFLFCCFWSFGRLDSFRNGRPSTLTIRELLENHPLGRKKWACGRRRLLARLRFNLPWSLWLGAKVRGTRGA